VVTVRDTRTQFVDAALVGDRTTAALLAASLLTEELTPRDIILQVLAPSQEDVGRRWEEQLCTVGQEHAATSVTEAILASITVGYEPPGTAGHFVMVCADGEWHSLPAKIAGELLILQGWRVTMVGAAIPIDHLRTYLADIDADAVGISCTLTTNLPGAARSIRAARSLGFTVVAGGRAFGSTPLRAQALGADGWVERIDRDFDLDSIVWDRLGLPDPTGEWARIVLNQDSIVEGAYDWLTSTYGSMPVGGGGWFDHTIADLDSMVGIAAAAALCNDRLVVAEHSNWWRSRLASNGLPEAAAAVGFEAVAAALEALAPTTAAMVTSVAHDVTLETRLATTSR
jgi:methanogenic corrinoid protein MtbC1